MDKQLSTISETGLGAGISKAVGDPKDMAISAFESITKAVENTDLNPDAVEKYLNMQLKLLDRQQEQEFRRCKIAAKYEMPVVTKNKKIEFKGKVQSRYADFDRIREVCDPILKKYGLSVDFNFGTNEKGQPTIQPYMDHINGYREYGGTQAYPIDNSGSKNGVQGVGSTNSYGSRYQYCAIAGIRISGLDNDAQRPKQVTPLGVNEQALVDDARAKSIGGMAAYEDWFRGIESAQERGWLVDEGVHAECKAAAAKADEFPGDR